MAAVFTRTRLDAARHILVQSANRGVVVRVSRAITIARDPRIAIGRIRHLSRTRTLTDFGSPRGLVPIRVESRNSLSGFPCQGTQGEDHRVRSGYPQPRSHGNGNHQEIDEEEVHQEIGQTFAEEGHQEAFAEEGRCPQGQVGRQALELSLLQFRRERPAHYEVSGPAYCFWSPSATGDTLCGRITNGSACR